jgi:hypothetical protein
MLALRNLDMVCCCLQLPCVVRHWQVPRAMNHAGWHFANCKSSEWCVGQWDKKVGTFGSTHTHTHTQPPPPPAAAAAGTHFVSDRKWRVNHKIIIQQKKNWYKIINGPFTLTAACLVQDSERDTQV